MGKKVDRVVFNEEDRKYLIFFKIRKFLKGNGKKYTKQEKEKFKQKQKIQELKDTRKERNKVVCFFC